MMLSAQTKDRREQLLADSKRALGKPMTLSQLVQQCGHRLLLGLLLEEALLMCCSTHFIDWRTRRSSSSSASADWRDPQRGSVLPSCAPGEHAAQVAKP